jgi:RNA polymerase sigma-70 factor, ECF subfamily
MGFLVATERDLSAGAEIFSQFCEDVWRGIGSFRGDASFRTWAYMVARHAGHRFHRDPYRKRGVPLADRPDLAEVAEKVRTTTLTYLKSEVRDAVQRLREQLDADEQALLVLRVDRKMDWNDIARILGDSGDVDARSLARRVTAYRKRYERVKTKLRRLAAREGLVQ